MAAKKSNLKPAELLSVCLSIANFERIVHEFPVVGAATQPPKPSAEEIAERTLERFRAEGVPPELLDDDADDGFEYIDSYGFVEYCCGTPPLSAEERVQRVLHHLDLAARKAERDGNARASGRRDGKQSAIAARNKLALALITKKYPHWMSEQLTVASLDDLVRLLTSENIVMSPDALRKMLRRSQQR